MTMAPTKPAAAIDTLCSLLEAELNSIFRFMEESSPYLSRATADACNDEKLRRVSGARCHCANQKKNGVKQHRGTAPDKVGA